MSNTILLCSKLWLTRGIGFGALFEDDVDMKEDAKERPIVESILMKNDEKKN